MKFQTRVNEIPCICHVTHFIPEVPMKVYGTGFGDADPPEPAEWEIELLDTKGRRATWLDKYLTEETLSRLFDEFLATRWEADQLFND